MHWCELKWLWGLAADSEEDTSEMALGDESQVPPAEELTDLQFKFEVKAVRRSAYITPQRLIHGVWPF